MKLIRYGLKYFDAILTGLNIKCINFLSLQDIQATHCYETRDIKRGEDVLSTGK